MVMIRLIIKKTLLWQRIMLLLLNFGIVSTFKIEVKNFNNQTLP